MFYAIYWLIFDHLTLGQA